MRSAPPEGDRYQFAEIDRKQAGIKPPRISPSGIAAALEPRESPLMPVERSTRLLRHELVITLAEGRKVQQSQTRR